MSIIATILAILKALPVLDSWFQQLSAAYVQSRLASMKKENYDAIKKAILEKDQRDAEMAIGNPHPGEASGDSGAVIIDHPPPGVHNQAGS